MKITRLEDCPQKTVEMAGAAGAQRQTPIGKADGAPNFSLRVFTLTPGGHTPHHEHPFEHVNYVLEGSGEILSDQGPHPIRRGDFLLVAPGERHQYRNTGSVPLVFMCLVPSAYE
jgi:quercetin dioxygenase-like cupin family protein